MGNERYYMTPRGLLVKKNIPEGWGLLEVSGKRVFQAVPATWNEDKDWRSEQGLLVSCLRRVGPLLPEGVAVKFYTFIEGSKNRATLGVAL